MTTLSTFGNVSLERRRGIVTKSTNFSSHLIVTYTCVAVAAFSLFIFCSTASTHPHGEGILISQQSPHLELSSNANVSVSLKMESVHHEIQEGGSSLITGYPSKAPIFHLELEDPNFPWKLAAPTIDDVIIPSWIHAYSKFHNESLQNAHRETKDTDKNKYLIFTCFKSCSGTGNRQRAIFASFMMAMVTNRIFLIDISFPVRLESILLPNTIRWNWFPPHMNQLKVKQLKLRNKNPPMLDSPSKFLSLSHIPVLRVEANTPVNLEQQWRSAEVAAYVTKYGDARANTVPGALYKQLFWTLYRPTPALTQAAISLRKELQIEPKVLPNRMRDVNTTTKGTETNFPTNLHSYNKYIALHARTGGDGHYWKDKDRFTFDGLDNMMANAKMVRQGMLQSSSSSSTNNMTYLWPIVVVSDDPQAKKTLKEMEPSLVRYADTKIIHVDRTKPEWNDLDGSIAVWADILILSQASCIVKGRGSFSMLGAWLAAHKFGSSCMHLVI